MPLIIPNTNPSSIAQVTDSSTISQESLRQLDVSTIGTEISRIRNSISHLERSNQELSQFADSAHGDDGLGESDRAELKNSVQENQGVISRQSNLVSRLETILLEKTGVASNNPHYAINADPLSAPNSIQSPSNVQNDLNSRARQVLSGGDSDPQTQSSGETAQSGNDEGMHL